MTATDNRATHTPSDRLRESGGGRAAQEGTARKGIRPGRTSRSASAFRDFLTLLGEGTD
ncbi:hypothetical protein [Streptomyces tibetensis]|uniref:hypothetical protein n=1 Tax=Streptomyces tibetensis TaxID=2382123 RepID=UPI0033FC5727